MEQREREPAPKLEDPTATARGYADALALMVASQQRRIGNAERRLREVRRTLALVQPYMEYCASAGMALGGFEAKSLLNVVVDQQIVE